MHYQSISTLEHLSYEYSPLRMLMVAVIVVLIILLVVLPIGIYVSNHSNYHYAKYLKYIIVIISIIYYLFAMYSISYLHITQKSVDSNYDIQIIKNRHQINHDWHLAYQHYHKHNTASFSKFKHAYSLKHHDNKYFAQIYNDENFDRINHYHYIPKPKKFEKLL